MARGEPKIKLHDVFTGGETDTALIVRVELESGLTAREKIGTDLIAKREPRSDLVERG